MSIFRHIRDDNTHNLDNDLLNKSLTLRLIYLFFRRLYFLIIVLIGLPFGIIADLTTLPFRQPWRKWYNNIKIKLFPPNIKKAVRNHGKKLDKQYYYTLGNNFKLNENKPMEYFILEFLTTYRRQFFTYDRFHNIICGRNCRRSLGDIYLLCKYYYPGCKIEEVLTHLVYYAKRRLIDGCYCNETHKFMFHGGDGGNLVRHSKVEYGNFTFKEVMETYV